MHFHFASVDSLDPRSEGEFQRGSGAPAYLQQSSQLPEWQGMPGDAASMETEGEVQSQAKGAASGLNISLHPLVVINISDHTTRKRSLNNNKPTRVLGVLLGVQVLIKTLLITSRGLEWQCCSCGEPLSSGVTVFPGWPKSRGVQLL
jgi:hypothetical protein